MAWVQVQSAGATDSAAAASISASFANPTTVGNIIVASLSAFSDGTTSVSDGSNSYTSAVSVGHLSDTVQIWYAPVTTAIQTVTFSTTAPEMFASMSIDEYSYTGALSVDGTATLAYGSTNSPATGDLTVSGYDLIYAALGTAAACTFTAGSGLTIVYSADYVSSQANGICVEDDLNVTSGVTPSWSLSGAVDCLGCAVALRTTLAPLGGGPLAWNLARDARRAIWGPASAGYPPAPVDAVPPIHRAIVTVASVRTRAGRVWLPFGPSEAAIARPPLGTLEPESSPRRPSRGRVWQPALVGPAATALAAPPLHWTIAAGRSRARPGRVLEPAFLAPQYAQGAAPATLRPITSTSRPRPGRAVIPPFLAPAASGPTAGVAPWKIASSSVRAKRGSGAVLAPCWLAPAPAPAVAEAPPWRIVQTPSRPRRGAVIASRGTPYVPPAPPVYNTPLNWSVVSRHGERQAVARLLQGGRQFGAALPPQAPGLWYNVYSNRGTMWYIDYTTPIATTFGLTWTSPPLSFPDTWMFAVRAVNGYGEEQNLDCYVEIILDGNGKNITNRPNPPTGLRAFATAGGGTGSSGSIRR